MFDKFKWFVMSPIRAFSTITFLVVGLIFGVVIAVLGWWAIPIIVFYGGGGFLVYFSIFLPVESFAARDFRTLLKGYPRALRNFWTYFKK